MFDQSSGQVFKEWAVPRRALSSQPERLDWSRRRPYRLGRAHGRHGPRSLDDMAIRVVADNIGELTVAHLDALPHQVQWRIWTCLEHRYEDPSIVAANGQPNPWSRGFSLHAWKLFNRLLFQKDGTSLALRHFRQHICEPVASLSIYLAPLTSPSVDFITHLVISGGCSFTVPELLCLADMKNLGVLELVQPMTRSHDFPQVNDRLTRGWTEKHDPFPLLRVLKIWGDQLVTPVSLRCVSKFPSLAVYDILANREEWRDPTGIAQEQGWKATRVRDECISSSLMLFAPQGEITDLSAPWDIDLALFPACTDPGSVVKFVPDGQAPPLVEYLIESDEVYRNLESPVVPKDPTGLTTPGDSCHGKAFDPWAFWHYSTVGQLIQDSDLKSRGVRLTTQAMIGSLVAPSKPMACLHLGHNAWQEISTRATYARRGLFRSRRYIFTRKPGMEGMNVKKPEAHSTRTRVAESSKPIKDAKRRRLNDVLQTFGEY